MKLWQSLALGFAISAPAAQAEVFFEERFDNANLGARGWYDVSGVYLATQAPHSAPAALEFRFARGARTADTDSIRRAFPESESVYLSYRVKYSDNWVGSNRSYHPHLFYFLTNADTAYQGPAETNLTVYAEAVGGQLRLALQDSQNIDTRRVNQNLVNVTENRAVAGCNGETDGIRGTCYKAGSGYRNGKSWKAEGVNFSNERGPSYKGDWHHVEVFVKLNSVVDGRGQSDGVMQAWIDGKPVIDKRNVVLRTGKHPGMRFNQLVLGPYIGDGSPVEQSFWIDDVVVAAAPPQPAAPMPAAEQPPAAAQPTVAAPTAAPQPVQQLYDPFTGEPLTVTSQPQPAPAVQPAASQPAPSQPAPTSYPLGFYYVL